MENQSVYAVFDDCQTLEDTKLFSTTITRRNVLIL